LQALQYGKPLVLLPAVVLGRFQHDFLATRADSPLRPDDLAGRRVGVRSYTVTTVAWVRAILQHQYGVDPRRVTWVAYEDAHLAEFRDPANVERFERGDRTLDQLLLAGEFDAAILNAPVKNQPGLRPLIADPTAASAAWFARFGVITINHLFVVNTALSRERPDLVREIYGLLHAAKNETPILDRGVDILPFGVENNRRHLAFAIECALEQGLITRRFTVDELFDDTTRLH
jgi:4,5-dihydroxyphthalate decarboxylase